MKKIHKFIFISLSPTGSGLSGGDRIFIELAREWSKSISITIFTTSEGLDMCKKQKLSGKYLKIIDIGGDLPKNFLLKYLYKIVGGIKLGLTLNINHNSSNINHYIYSSSEFWMDSLPCLLLKIRYPNLKWVASWYQTAPNPFKGFTENPTSPKSSFEVKRENKYHFSSLVYWVMQLPIKPLIKVYADFVIVNNEDERKQFLKMDKKNKVIVLIGAVRLDDIEKYKALNIKHHPLPKIYDAVFQGRFHPQKGVVELIDIWRKVVNKIPNAKLAMIGDGPLMDKVRSQITKYKLQNNVKLFGFVFDGPEKYKIFSQSKIVVHPSLYDSGGMASAEAMAFGLPCVGFNLKSYKSYYPKGMLKAMDNKSFADSIMDLLKNEINLKRLGKEAKNLIYKSYSWKGRAIGLYNELFYA